MKLAVAGKGGVGKTTLTVWLGDYLARKGEDVWLVDADTALSLGPALGLEEDQIPIPLVKHKDLIQERVGSGGFINLNPRVDDLIDSLSLEVREGLHLLVMGTIAGAGSGCGCAPNALLKALLVHLVFQTSQHLLVDLEAGVEHLGRGTVSQVDGLVVVSEPSLRALNTASQISSLATDLGLKQQALVMNRTDENFVLPEGKSLPQVAAVVPPLASLQKRQQSSASVLDLEDRERIDALCEQIVSAFQKQD
ncbi:MAG: AAA family ATPase [Desulfohalobiaceae bacterium]|nr:AAA family ATPase [Desulfohalobiaceae bacterium]